MMNELLKTVVEQSVLVTPAGTGGPVVLTSTGDKFSISIAAPIRILKWGVILSTSLDTTNAAMILKLDQRITAGSDTGRVTLDTLTVPVTNTTYVAGTGIYRDPYTASTKHTTTDEPTGFGPNGVNAPDQEYGQQQLTFTSGQELILKVDTAAGTAGQGRMFVEYVMLPISKPSGYGTTDAGTVSLTDKLTRFAS